MTSSRTIRIAHIIGKMHAGGVESVVFNYYRFIDKKTLQFDFFYDSDSTVEPPQELLDMGARFYQMPPYQKLPQYLKELRQILRRNQYQIIHSHLNTLSVFPLFIAWLEHIPVRIAHNHSVPGKGEFLRNAMKYTIRSGSKWFATDYFACSEKAGRWLFGDHEYEKGNVKIIRNAIDFERFKPNEGSTSVLREKYGLNGKFVVGHVGRLTYAKNHSFLLGIFAQIKKQNPNAVLILVGDGELYDAVTLKAHNLGLEDDVKMVGSVSNPEHYYPLADVILLPSVFEGMPVTSIEAQIAGVPILVSEAVPDEAIISNGFRKLPLSAGAKQWASAAMEAATTEVILYPDSAAYDIRKAAPKLTQWYLNKRKPL